MKEVRVYIVDSIHPFEISDEAFIEIAEEQGTVYTLAGFQENFNDGNIDESGSYLRFIEVVNFDSGVCPYPTNWMECPTWNKSEFGCFNCPLYKKNK